MTEIWVVAKGHPDYLVSNYGSVVKRVTREPVRIFMTKDREAVNLRTDGWDYIVMLNRLVAGSFFDGEMEGMEVNHLDGDRHNNCIWNLEIVTREENREHAYHNRLMQRPLRIQNLETGEIYESCNEAGRRLGLLSAVNVPLKAKQSGSEFRSGGYRLKLV